MFSKCETAGPSKVIKIKNSTPISIGYKDVCEQASLLICYSVIRKCKSSIID